MMLNNPLFSNEMLKPLLTQNHEWMNPARRINSLLVDQLAVMTDTQLKALENYSLMGLEQMKKATEIKDSESAHHYSLSQAEFFAELSKKALADAQQLAEMNQQLKQNIEKELQGLTH